MTEMRLTAICEANACANSKVITELDVPLLIPDFPVDEFFPPERCEFLEDGEDDPSVPEDDRRNNGNGGRR